MLYKLPLIKDDYKNQENYGEILEDFNHLSHRRKTLQGTN